MCLNYNNYNINTSPGQSGAAVYLIKNKVNTLEELLSAFDNREFNLNQNDTQMIAIHDGSADGVLNYAAIIDRKMINTFI